MSNQKAQLSTMLPSYHATDPGGWEHLVEFAVAADAAGFDRLAIPDHVVFGEDLEAYADPANGGAKGGRQPTGPDGAWLEPITTIAFLSALTSRVRFSTNILIAALRRPVVLAKMAATIDVLSSGRLDLGVGVGWQREEYEAAGLSFEGRGSLLNLTIEICQLLWREPVATFTGHEISFSQIHQMPKPHQPGGVPIWVSGRVNRRSMDRLANYGTGWIPWGDDAADLAEGVSRMRQAMVARNRDPATVQVIGTLRRVLRDSGELDIESTMAGAPSLIDAGATDVRIMYLQPPRGEQQATDFFSELHSAFHRAVA